MLLRFSSHFTSRPQPPLPTHTNPRPPRIVVSPRYSLPLSFSRFLFSVFLLFPLAHARALRRRSPAPFTFARYFRKSNFVTRAGSIRAEDSVLYSGEITCRSAPQARKKISLIKRYFLLPPRDRPPPHTGCPLTPGNQPPPPSSCPILPFRVSTTTTTRGNRPKTLDTFGRTR